MTPITPTLTWHAERHDSGTLIVVSANGKQWASLITDNAFRGHYDKPWLFWQTMLGLKYAALGLKKCQRVVGEFLGDL